MEVQIKDNKIYAPLKDKFEKEWLQNFKPVLNKLLDVFQLKLMICYGIVLGLPLPIEKGVVMLMQS